MFKQKLAEFRSASKDKLSDLRYEVRYKTDDFESWMAEMTNKYPRFAFVGFVPPLYLYFTPQAFVSFIRDDGVRTLTTREGLMNIFAWPAGAYNRALEIKLIREQYSNERDSE